MTALRIGDEPLAPAAVAAAARAGPLDVVLTPGARARMAGRRLTLGCTAVKRAANELAEVLG